MFWHCFLTKNDYCPFLKFEIGNFSLKIHTSYLQTWSSNFCLQIVVNHKYLPPKISMKTTHHDNLIVIELQYWFYQSHINLFVLLYLFVKYFLKSKWILIQNIHIQKYTQINNFYWKFNGTYGTRLCNELKLITKVILYMIAECAIFALKHH